MKTMLAEVGIREIAIRDIFEDWNYIDHGKTERMAQWSTSIVRHFHMMVQRGSNAVMIIKVSLQTRFVERLWRGLQQPINKGAFELISVPPKQSMGVNIETREARSLFVH